MASSLKKYNNHHLIELNPTIDTDAYQAGDVVGGLLTLPCGPSTLRQVKLVDNDNEGAELSLYLFRGTPTSIADDAAFASAFTEADNRLLIDEPLVFSTYTTINNEKKSIKGGHADGAGLGIECTPVDGLNIYAYAVCTATPTYAALKLFWQFLFWTDRA